MTYGYFDWYALETDFDEQESGPAPLASDAADNDLVFCEQCGDAPAVERDGWICCGSCKAQIRRSTPIGADAELRETLGEQEAAPLNFSR